MNAGDRATVFARVAVAMSAGLWAAVMVVMGLLVALEFPSRFGPMGWRHGQPAMVALGVVCLATGQGMFAGLARRVFPGASKRLTGGYALLPWALLVVGAVYGVLLWIN